MAKKLRITRENSWKKVLNVRGALETRYYLWENTFVNSYNLWISHPIDRLLPSSAGLLYDEVERHEWAAAHLHARVCLSPPVCPRGTECWLPGDAGGAGPGPLRDHRLRQVQFPAKQVCFMTNTFFFRINWHSAAPFEAIHSISQRVYCVEPVLISGHGKSYDRGFANEGRRSRKNRRNKSYTLLIKNIGFL